MTISENVLADHTTKTGKKLRLQLFPHAPLASLTFGNRRNGANSVTVDVDDAIVLRDALARLVDLLLADG